MRGPLRLAAAVLVVLWPMEAGRAQSPPPVREVRAERTSVPIFEKYEARFQVATSARVPFFEFTRTPPPGVSAGVGITVTGVVRTPSGRTVEHPAFFTHETAVVRPGAPDMYFEETGGSHWVLRYSPQEEGAHQVSVRIEDASGTREAPIGTFTAHPPTRDGFIRVSEADPRYFTFSNGRIYWPIGPAWLRDSNAYARYRGGEQNFERVWMGAPGAYSTNWARWKSSAEDSGNEGVMTRLTGRDPAPGFELSYELFHPQGYRLWIAAWQDEAFHGRLTAGQRYKVRFVYRTDGLAGPSPRCPSCPFGLVVRASDADAALWGNPTQARVEQVLRDADTIVAHVANADGWQTVETTFRASAGTHNLHVYLDNVTAGRAQVALLSIQPIDGSGRVTGGEVVRNPSADQHTYVEARGAAFFDWQLEQAERHGVFIKYVVHDKNDWIQNHLDAQGRFVDAPVTGGYYQPEGTKAQWLLRQWYRYVVARWGYSTAVHSFELNNEGPPDAAADGTSPHWEAAQRFARTIHALDAHRHLASTSFWCCWRPAFWGNRARFPDIDHADIHDYSHNSAVTDARGVAVRAADVTGWIAALGRMVQQDRVGKPVMLGELGLTDPGWKPVPALASANPGYWYHDLLWAQLHAGSVTAPNYWFADHVDRIDRVTIARPFARFVASLDVHRGGYEDLEPRARVSNADLRIVGQLQPSTGSAYFWLQFSRHGWQTPDATPQDGEVIIAGLPAGRPMTLERWDTYTGEIRREPVTIDAAGEAHLRVANLVRDAAFKLLPR